MLARNGKLAPHSLKTLECISNEWQRHVSRVLVPEGIDFLAVHGRGILLGDLVNREVAHIDIGRQLGLEGGTDAAKVVPLDVVEKGMALDFLGAILARFGAEAVTGVA